MSQYSKETSPFLIHHKQTSSYYKGSNHRDRLTWHQSSQWLVILISVSVSLPPVRVRLTDYVQDVSFLEGQAELSTWYVRVVGGVIVKVGLHMDLQNQIY